MLISCVLIGLIVAAILFWRRLEQIKERIAALQGQVAFGAMPATTGPWEAPLPLAPHVAENVAAVEPVEAPAIVPPAHVPPAPEPVAEPASWQPAPPRVPKIDFEDVFGRRLPIWAGGITLAVAGALIVRISIEAGLFPPVVRVLMGMLFGAGLIGGAELAHGRTVRVGDPRVAQALAGAGIAIFYASIVVAANLYHLIAPLTAFVGLAATTAGAMGLAVRFGEPSALLGLVGGLAAPVLAGSGPANVPLLAAYLGLVVGGLCAVSRRQRLMWLGIGALIGGFGWGGVLIVGGALSDIAAASVGVYVLLIGLALPLVTGGSRRADVRMTSSLIAAVEIAAMVALGDFAMLDWGLFGLMSIGIVWLARRDTSLVRLPALALAMLLALIGYWPQPNGEMFVGVIIGMVLIYGAPAFAGLWRPRGSLIEAGQLAALGLGSFLMSLLHFHHDRSEAMFGALALVCAVLPAAAAAAGWAVDARRSDARFATLATSAAILVAAAGLLALPVIMVPAWVAATGLGALMLGRVGDLRMDPGAWALAAASILLLTLDHRAFEEIAIAGGWRSADAQHAAAVLRWSAIAPILAAFAWKGRQPIAGAAAQMLAVLTSYVAVAVIVPDMAKAAIPAVQLVLLACWSRSLDADRLLPAMSAAICLSLVWAIQPLGQWALPALGSLFAQPMPASALPDVRLCLSLLLLPAGLIGTAVALAKVRRGARLVALPIAALLAAVALHSLYRHAFASVGSVEFADWGVAERAIWDMLLIGFGLLAWQLGSRVALAKPLAIGLIAASLVHAVWYSIVIHNPLWAGQTVGNLPLFNWVAPIYALPLAILASARALPEQAVRHDRARSIAQMLLILLFGFSELRQLFHGTWLSAPGVTGAEDVLRSIMAIGGALAFLAWGIRRRSRDWRLGSLLLMLGAVGKVFLVDTSGLDGVLRIASFVALGFSLIGVGWFYSRCLTVDAARSPK